jgi:hypothetical protein
MQTKPTILVISHKIDFSQHPSFSRLKDTYTFVFYKLRLKQSITTNLKNIALLFPDNNRPQAVIGFNDHTSLLAAAVSKKYNLIGPTPESLAYIQDKRIFHQQLSQTDFLPNTTILDLSKKNIFETNNSVYFIKPVKGSLSEGAIKIADQQELRLFFENPPLVSQTLFDQTYFELYSPQSNLKLFLIQPYINQRQCTLDGFILNKKAYFLGITESLYDTEKKSFIRFDFPFIATKKLISRLEDIMRVIITKTQFTDTFFNLEFFIDDENSVTIIEVNTRTAFVFEPFYNSYYQTPLVQMIVELALGKKPSLKKKTKTKLCKSFILRKNVDLLVKSIPSHQQIEELLKQYNVEQIKVLCFKNKLLSKSKQDAYSYRYASVDICGDSEEDIVTTYIQVKHELDRLIVFN